MGYRTITVAEAIDYLKTMDQSAIAEVQIDLIIDPATDGRSVTTFVITQPMVVV